MPPASPVSLRYTRGRPHIAVAPPKQARPTRTRRPDPPRRMWRDAAAEPTVASASQPIAAVPMDAVVIDVERAAQPAEAHGVGCRICHLGPEGDGSPAPGSEVIRLGCGCKDELGAAHRQCAEAWFRIKGDRRCEICGSDAKNITGLEVKKFMEKWHGQRVTSTQTTEERESHCWRQQPFCNFLLASLLIIFMLPWFLRVNMF
uniref:RING-CH-type domain-containing protein n=1 Tax=Arundo donax TaxID=35708 RepID=A0A0A9HI73_ARUDO